MDTESFSLIIGAVLSVVSPIAISILKKDSWSKVTKVAIPVIVSMALGTGYMWINGYFSGLSWAEATLMAFGLQQLAYVTFLKKATEWLEHNVNPSEEENP